MQLDLFQKKEGFIKDVFLQNVVVRLVLLNGRIWVYYGKCGITEKYIPIGGCHLEIFETDNPEQVEKELRGIKC